MSVVMKGVFTALSILVVLTLCLAQEDTQVQDSQMPADESPVDTSATETSGSDGASQTGTETQSGTSPEESESLVHDSEMHANESPADTSATETSGSDGTSQTGTETQSGTSPEEPQSPAVEPEVTTVTQEVPVDGVSDDTGEDESSNNETADDNETGDDDGIETGESEAGTEETAETGETGETAETGETVGDSETDHAPAENEDEDTTNTTQDDSGSTTPAVSTGTPSSGDAGETPQSGNTTETSPSIESTTSATPINGTETTPSETETEATPSANTTEETNATAEVEPPCEPDEYLTSDEYCAPCVYGSPSDQGWNASCACNTTADPSCWESSGNATSTGHLRVGIRFSNMNFTSDLRNTSSEQYNALKNQVSSAMTEGLANTTGVRNVKFLGFGEGSVISAMGVEVDGSITGGVVAGAQAVSDTLESLTSSGTFAGETVTPFQPADLQQQGSPDLTHVFFNGDIVSTCAQDTECAGYSDNAVCQSQSSIKMCMCNVMLGYYMNDNGDGCVNHVTTGHPCSTGHSVCVDDHTQCAYNNQLDGMFTCMCIPGYFVAHSPEGDKCAHKINEVVDSACELCVQNEGTCYDLDSDLLRDGCSCPISRTGENCQKIHAHVSCLVNEAALEMKICYVPHEGVDLSREDDTALQTMHTNEHKDDIHCRGREPDVGECDDTEATRVLRLSLADDQLESCGVRKFPQPDSILYKSLIIVDRYDILDSYRFSTFCSYTTTVRATSGVGSVAVADSQTGSEILPQLVFEPRLSNNYPVENGDTIRSSDTLRIHAYLNNDLFYGALLVDNCIFSTSPVTPVPDYAQSISALYNSCPTDAGVFNNANNFGSYRGLPYYMLADEILMPMFSNSLTHMHCIIKVCLNNEIDQCVVPSCDSGASFRKRRAASNPSTDYVMMSKSMRVVDEKDGDTPAEDTITISAGQVGLIGGIIGVVVVVLVVGTIALVLVVVKRRQTAGYQGAGGGPIFNMRQRFFKPRNAKVNTIA